MNFFTAERRARTRTKNLNVHRSSSARTDYAGSGSVSVMVLLRAIVTFSLLTTAHVIAVEASSGHKSSLSLAETDYPTVSEKSRSSGPVGIMILAQGRSGSTMLGELFRQNEDVLYWYEPCRTPQSERSVVDEECHNLVRRLTSCEFTLEDSRWVSKDHTSVKNGSPILRGLLKEDQLARVHTKILTTCKKSRAAVAKVIRIFEGVMSTGGGLSGPRILHLVRDPRAVVRSELKNFKHISTATNDVSRAYEIGQRICNRYRMQLDSSSDLDDTRYLRVKYEDIATSPELALELIYCWSDLRPVPEAVSSWVRENTQLPGCKENTVANVHDAGKRTGDSDGGGGGRRLNTQTTTEGKTASSRLPPIYDGLGKAKRKYIRGYQPQRVPLVSQPRGTHLLGSLTARRMGTSAGHDGDSEEPPCDENSKQSEEDPYGTRRHSAAMVGLWRSQMPDEDAVAVWEACEGSGVMEDLFYAP